MNYKLRAAIALACLTPISAMADVALYGRANLSLQQDSISDSTTKGVEKSTQTLNSNASRIGLKGSEKLWNVGLEAIYVAEFEASFDDGRSGSDNSETFKQRNIYLGVKGDFGTVIAGNFDSAMKKSQAKVDLFNDLRGDIASQITTNEYRLKNSVMYSTPNLSGFTGYVDWIASEIDGVDSGSSLALSYENKALYVSLAYDTNVSKDMNVVVDTNALRAVAQYTVANFQFGLLVDKNTNNDTDVDTTGFIGSVQYTYDKWAFKGQFGQSDIKPASKDVDVLSLGVDYNMSKVTKVFGFVTTEQADAIVLPATPAQVEVDNTFIGVGMEMNF